MANVFGALNRFISRLDSDPLTATPSGQPRNAVPSNAYGFQVLRNIDPKLGLEPWFDFIIGINGHNIESSDPELFKTEVSNCAGATISLGVYGAKGRQIRETYVTIPPAGQGANLGLSLQWSPLSAVDDVWHILDVIPNSPADVAGLLPYSDYVVGSPEDIFTSLHGEPALAELVERHLDQPLRLFVYNHEYDVTRLVTITPARNWGGDGILGCVLGYGVLHRIPAPLEEPTQAPGETLFDTATIPQPTEQSYLPPTSTASGTSTPQPDLLVPANLPQSTSTSPAPPPPAGKPRKQRAHHAAPTAGLDDYFAEGEQRSRELDNAPKAKAGGGLPPPPKAGGPPKAASPAPPAAEGDGVE